MLQKEKMRVEEARLLGKLGRRGRVVSASATRGDIRSHVTSLDTTPTLTLDLTTDSSNESTVIIIVVFTP